jgi:hypothetical protein
MRMCMDMYACECMYHKLHVYIYVCVYIYNAYIHTYIHRCLALASEMINNILFEEVRRKKGYVYGISFGIRQYSLIQVSSYGLCVCARARMYVYVHSGMDMYTASLFDTR